MTLCPGNGNDHAEVILFVDTPPKHSSSARRAVVGTGHRTCQQHLKWVLLAVKNRIKERNAGQPTPTTYNLSYRFHFGDDRPEYPPIKPERFTRREAKLY